MKVDLVMWAKNGGRFLPAVLKRVDEVIPVESVYTKIFVDDKSTDNSREIAQSFNWTVYDNTSGFVSGGTNTALHHVTMPFFVSIEQDVLLAKDWWDRIPPHMADETVAVAQGIRLPTHPIIRELEPLDHERLKQQIRNQVPDYYWSIDNNIFRTKVVREVGGFPTFEPLAVDYFLMKRIQTKTKYRWIVDPRVVSDHIRLSLVDYFRHDENFIRLTTVSQIGDSEAAPLSKMIRLTVTSPLRGLDLAVRKGDPMLSAIYPFYRLMYLRAYFLRRRQALEQAESSKRPEVAAN
jgi:glycosyltransferase involved in cell wall biosynthesis